LLLMGKTEELSTGWAGKKDDLHRTRRGIESKLDTLTLSGDSRNKSSRRFEGQPIIFDLHP